jgi:hypothetical protein
MGMIRTVVEPGLKNMPRKREARLWRSWTPAGFRVVPYETAMRAGSVPAAVGRFTAKLA